MLILGKEPRSSWVNLNHSSHRARRGKYRIAFHGWDDGNTAGMIGYELMANTIREVGGDGKDFVLFVRRKSLREVNEVLESIIKTSSWVDMKTVSENRRVRK